MTNTPKPPLTVHRLDPSTPLPKLGYSNYQWVLRRGNVVVGFFATRKQAEEFRTLSNSYHQ